MYNGYPDEGMNNPSPQPLRAHATARRKEPRMSHGCPGWWIGSFADSQVRSGCDRCYQDCPQFIDIAEGERQDLSGLFDDPNQLLGVVFLNPINAHDIGMHRAFSMGTGIGASECTLAERQSQMSHGWLSRIAGGNTGRNSGVQGRRRRSARARVSTPGSTPRVLANNVRQRSKAASASA